MTEVRRRKEETSENLIKRFMRKMKKEGILEEYMSRQHYTKPSVKRRQQALKRRAYLRKQQQKYDKIMRALDD